MGLRKARAQGLWIHLVLNVANVQELLDPPATAVVRPGREDVGEPVPVDVVHEHARAATLEIMLQFAV